MKEYFNLTSIFLGGLLVFALLPFLSENVHARFEMWQHDGIDCPRSFSYPGLRNLWIDPVEQMPCMILGGSQVGCFRRNLDEWTESRIAENAAASVEQIILDESGTVVFAYYDMWTQSVNLATGQAGEWTTSTLEQSLAFSLDPVAVKGSGSEIHIFFSDPIFNRLHHIYEDASGWRSDDFQFDFNAGMKIAAASDSQGIMHILVADKQIGRIVEVTWADETWNSEPVYQNPCSLTLFNFMSLSVLVDGLDHIHAAFTEPQEIDSALRYLHFDGSQWSSELVADDLIPDTNSTSSICLNSSGEPVLVFSTGEQGQFKSALRTGSVWNITDIEGITQTGYFGALAITPADDFYCSHFNLKSPSVSFLTRHDGTWNLALVGPSYQTGYEHDAVMDSTNRIHVSYVSDDHLTPALKYACRSQKNWSVETVDAGLHVGPYSAVAALSDSAVHIGYADILENNLKCAHKAESGWDIETADASGSVFGNISITLDTEGYPHIGYHSGTGMMHAYMTQTGWKTEIVDDRNVKDDTSSILCDSSGIIHLAYHTAGSELSDQLVYAFRNGETWQVETVDGTEGDKAECDMALDSYDYPHIAYRDMAQNDVWYAYRDGTGWHRERVDSEGILGNHISMVTDGFNDPHIAYSASCMDYSCLYAYKDETGWYIEPVSNALWDLSLVLDEQFEPLILSGLYGLQYAHRQIPVMIDDIGVRLMIAGSYFYPGKPFWLNMTLINHSTPVNDTPLFVIMEVEGGYWFYPSWTQDVDYQVVSVPTGVSSIPVFSEFIWPETGDMYMRDIYFYAALVDPGITGILGGLDGMSVLRISFGPDPGCE